MRFQSSSRDWRQSVITATASAPRAAAYGSATKPTRSPSAARSALALAMAWGSVTTRSACSSARSFATVSAGVSRVSEVSALKAKPKSAMRFPATVLNIASSIVRTKRFC